MAYMNGQGQGQGGSIWDWFTQPPANQPMFDPNQYQLPQVSGGGAMPMDGGGRPNNGPFPNVVPPLPEQAPPMRKQAIPPSFNHPVAQILQDPEGVAAKAAAAGVRPPAIPGGGATGAEGADWTAELMSGSPPAAGSNLSNEALTKGFGAVTGQESGMAQRPSGSANVSVGTETPGAGVGQDKALQYLLSLMMSGGGGKATNLREMIGSR